MPGIVPHLWFDTQAVEAAHAYCETFPDSRVVGVTTLQDTPSGDVDSVTSTSRRCLAPTSRRTGDGPSPRPDTPR